MRSAGKALKKRRSRRLSDTLSAPDGSHALAGTETGERRTGTLGAASATRRAASARPRAPSEINVGIEAFSRRASSAASPSSASQR